MRPFRYTRVADSTAALAAGAAPGAAFLGGGTTLVDLMKLGVETPNALVDVTRVAPGLDTPAVIAETKDGLTIPAGTLNSDVAANPFVRARYPVLAEALLSGASPQIRNMATVAGNLLQRTRCAYFRDVGVDACNKRAPGSGCAAIGGWSRMHAILGGSDRCIAVNPSDMCVALTALDAVVHTRRAQGTREIPIDQLHTLPGEHPEVESVLDRGELITHVTLPASPFSTRSRYVKARDRAAFAFALSSAAVALAVDGRDGAIRAARVAVGGVATKPWRCQAVEQALVGEKPGRAAFERAAKLAVTGARTTPNNAFKVTLVQRTIVRALERVMEETR